MEPGVARGCTEEQNYIDEPEKWLEMSW